MVAIDPNQLGQAVHDLLHAADKEQVILILKQNPWLLHHADSQLTQVIINNSQRNNLVGVAMFSAARGLLRRCRDTGIEQTLSRQPAWPLVDHGPLISLLQLPAQAPPEILIQAAAQAQSDIDKESEPDVYGLILHHLGVGYQALVTKDDTQNRDAAIASFSEAVNLWQNSSIPFARALIGQAFINLGDLTLHHPRLRRRQSVTQALAWAQQAAAVIPLQSSDNITLNMLRGNAYLYNPTGERLHNIEQGINAYQKALQVPKIDKQKQLEIKHNLGVAYRRRLAGDAAGNYEKALTYAQDVLAEVETNSVLWARTTAELATIYAHRRKGDRSQNLEEAIASAKHALEVYQPDTHPQEHTQTKLILGNLYCDRLQGNIVQNHLQAIELFNDVLKLRTPENNLIGYAEAQNNLGTAYATLCINGGDSYYQKAVDCFQTALEIYQPDYLPARRQNAATNWGNLAFRFGRWQEAHEAFQQAILAGNELFAASATESGRRVELAQSAGLTAAETYCLLKLSRPTDALEELERGKARQLAEALALDSINLNNLPVKQRKRIANLLNELKPLEFELRTSVQNDQPAFIVELGNQIKQLRIELKEAIVSAEQLKTPTLRADTILEVIPDDAVLVAPVITAKGTAVFIIPGAVTAVSMDHILWLDNFSAKHLDVLLNGNDEETGWIKAYQAKLNTTDGFASWQTYINQFTRNLWDQLMGPIYHRLSLLNLPTGSAVILMLQGGAGFLPVHAARSENDGKSVTFIDTYAVTIAPSVYALQTSQRRLTDRQKATLLMVVNPTPDDPRQNLVNAPIEAHLVAAHFSPNKHVSLIGDAATKTAVISAMPSQAYLHYCCHGQYDWHNVMDSRLNLAHQNRLTLADALSNFILPNARLVTLSACETGLTELDVAPDEYVGLPGGFLQAGSPGVISTLWVVDDLSTAILMEQFYKNHLQDGQPPAQALRAAQLWVRQHTRAEIGAYYQALINENNVTMLSSFIIGIEMGGDADERPFAHPFYWAAFTFAGS